MTGGDPRGELHLVAVVEHLARLLGRLVPLDQRQQLLPGPLRFKHPPDRGRVLPGSAACCLASHWPTALTSPGARRCSARSPVSCSTAAVTVCGVHCTASIGPS